MSDNKYDQGYKDGYENAYEEQECHLNALRERIAELEKVAKAVERQYNRTPFETITFELRAAMQAAGYMVGGGE